ncbi:hybrid sensor histidine kinase/response regulator [Desulfonatronovibrio hydrogenovorans]|uniref:hybrid sensor histidine kinase/response regulator n=1 Tax=Desulfonatronovibrio hydrogenovorans TaxID=53245 RepID=UPI00048D3613|nr:response regulator [Desulfonatronovibrio hydrogenovorans]
MNILIVDDVAENLYLLEIMLKGKGHSVMTATNGQEALNILDSEGIDLIISDILMPVMDGFELCRRAKSDPRHGHIPFIIYTATYTGPKDKQFALKIGADRFIVKPCEPDEFMAQVEDVMKSALEDESPSKTLPAEDGEILKLYNERLVRKLEQKAAQLEEEMKKRVQSDKELRSQEALLRIAGEQARLGGWSVDLSENRVVWSDQVAAIHEMPPGYSPSVEEGISFYAPEYRERIREVFQACVTHGRPYDEEMQIITGQGRKVWIRTIGIAERDDSGRIVRIQGGFQDITFFKKAEEALRKSEQKFRVLAENAPMGIAVHELLMDDQGQPLDYVYLDVNPAFEVHTGLSRSEVLGQKASLVIPGFSRAPFLDVYAKVVLTGESIEFEETVESLDRHYLISAYKIADSQFVTVFLDVTPQKKAEEERQRLQDQLIQAQKMESVGMLAGGIAHDFNNLLHAMSTSVELLGLDKDDDHPDRIRLRTVEKAIDRAGQLIQKLLLFSRKAQIQKKILDLNREIMDCLMVLKRTIPRMINIELDLDNEAWPVEADPVQIEQVLLNLGSNAADAMPEGGTLCIETRNLVLEDDKYLDLEPGYYLLLTVSDTGLGIDRQALGHIFEPFYTTKETGKGTGLGLASVYGIVKAHGGRITCYSESGDGSTFRIYWPAVPGAEVENSEIESRSGLEGGKETILVVDDDQDIRDLTADVLETYGYTTYKAASGEESLGIYSQEKSSVDLVLLDLNMPGMGGLKCLEKLIEINPRVKVLIASGYSAGIQARKSTTLGAVGFIGKPFQIKDLLFKVRQALSSEIDT